MGSGFGAEPVLGRREAPIRVRRPGMTATEFCNSPLAEEGEALRLAGDV